MAGGLGLVTLRRIAIMPNAITKKALRQIGIR